MKIMNKFIYFVSKQKFYYNLKSYIPPFNVYCQLNKKNSISIRARNKGEQTNKAVELSMSNKIKGDLFLDLHQFTKNGLLPCYKLYLEFLKP